MREDLTTHAPASMAAIGERHRTVRYLLKVICLCGSTCSGQSSAACLALCIIWCCDPLSAGRAHISVSTTNIASEHALCNHIDINNPYAYLVMRG